MNFLAHAVLAEHAGQRPVLGLLGDFVRGRAEQRHTGAALHAIVLHRRIDRFVDGHGAHARARARLPAPWRRYAGVLMDVYFDHLLARDFAALTGHALRPYAQALYADLAAHAPGLPADLNRFAAHARARDLITGYAEPAVIGEVLSGIGARLRRPVPLVAALPLLQGADAALAADFAALWPDAVAFAQCAGGA